MLRNFIKSVCCVILIFIKVVSFAQNDKLGSWTIANLLYHLSPKVGLYGEVQTRSQLLTDDFFYHELKGGLLIYTRPKSSDYFFVGFGNSETYTFPGNFKKPVTANEYRIWEQFVINNKFRYLNLEHRYRIEQRWINGSYSNRFRYRINSVIALNHVTVIPHTVYITAFDEVFFTDKPPYFIRNRIFGGIGYVFSKLFALQTGFIRQFDYRTSDDGSGKNLIQTSLLFNINHIAVKKEVHPSTID